MVVNNAGKPIRSPSVFIALRTLGDFLAPSSHLAKFASTVSKMASAMMPRQMRYEEKPRR